MIDKLQELLLWAREHRIQVSSVRVAQDELELELVDLTLLETPPAKKAEEPWAPPAPPASSADLYAELARQHGINVGREELEREDEP